MHVHEDHPLLLTEDAIPIPRWTRLTLQPLHPHTRIHIHTHTYSGGIQARTLTKRPGYFGIDIASSAASYVAIECPVVAIGCIVELLEYHIVGAPCGVR